MTQHRRSSFLVALLACFALFGGACGEADDSSTSSAADAGDNGGGGAANVSDSGFEFGDHCFANGLEGDPNFGFVTVTYNGDDDVKVVADSLETDGEFETPYHYELAGTKDGPTLNLSGTVRADNQDNTNPVDAQWTWDEEGLDVDGQLHRSTTCTGR